MTTGSWIFIGIMVAVFCAVFLRQFIVLWQWLWKRSRPGGGGLGFLNPFNWHNRSDDNYK